MHLVTLLAECRGRRTIREIAEAADLNPAIVRQIEQGKLVPRDQHIPSLESAYGKPWTEWYSKLALAAIQEGDE